MPIYEYRGQQYELSTDDPQEAKSKILKHLGTSSEETSGLAAAGKSALENTLPSLGGLAAGSAAISAGAPMIAGATAINPLLGGATALGLGIAGGLGGSSVVHSAQNALTGLIPENIKEAVGFGKEQRAQETEEHPYASFAGSLAPNLLAFRPGAVAPIVDQAGKQIMGSTGQRVAMGGVGGAVEAGSELINEGKVDPLKVGMAAAFQGVAAAPTALGRKMMGTPKGGTPHDPEQPLADPTRNTEDAIDKAVFLDNSISRIQETIAYHTNKIKELAAVRDSMEGGQSTYGPNPGVKSRAQEEGIAKIDAAIARHEAKIQEAQAEIESHNGQIDALSEFTGYPREQLLPPKETPTNVTQKETSPFRSEDEAFKASQESSTEALTQGEALRKTAKEFDEYRAERESLLDIRGRTVEQDLRLAKLNDIYDELSVRNDPQNSLVDVIQSLRDELDDIKQFGSGYGKDFATTRTAQIASILNKYLEYQRRVENALKSKTEIPQLPQKQDPLIVPNDAVKATEAIKAAKETGTAPELPPISIDTVQGAKEIPPTNPKDTLENISTYRTDTGDIGYHATNKFLNSLINIPLAVAKRFISPWAFKNMFRNNRMVSEVGDMALKARHESTALKNELLYGAVGEDQFKADFGSSPLKIFKLNKVSNPDGLLQAIEQVKFKDLGNMIDGFVAAYRDGVSPWQNVDKYFPGISQEQRNLVRVIELVSTKMRERVNSSLKARGLAEIPDLPGYFPVHNAGKFYVDKKANGVLLERSWFFSKAEAEQYAKNLLQNDSRITAAVEDRKADVDYESIMEILNQLIASPNDARKYATEMRASIAQKASAVGQHKEHRSLIRGFSGERIGNQEERGRNFAQGLVNWVEEYANASRKRNLMYDASTYMSSQATEMLRAQQPNAFALTQHFLDNELNLYGTKEPTTHINAIGDWVSNKINNTHYNLFGEHLKGDVIDSAFNAMKRLGYNVALTAKPVTWISQALASIQSSRMIFKAGGNPIEAMGAAMKGIQDTFLKTYDEDAMRGFYHVSQNMDVLHKTIHHDLGGLDATSVNKSALDKWYSRLIGEKMTEGADTFSRVVSYNMAYNVLKAQGMKGKALWEAAGNMAAENMIPMGRENLPSIYKEAGFVGTALSPLKGFIHGSMSNLVTDVKDIVQNPSIGNSLALTANVMSMLILGGLAGLPMLADYEYIRQLLVKSGHMAADTLPNWTEIVENRPTWAARGAMSALTDVDLSASTRYQSILKPYGDILGAQSLADMSLPFSVASKAIGGAMGIAQDTLGNVPVDQARKNWDAVLPAGPLRGIKEDVYDKRGFNTFGNRGEALIERGPKERLASYLGSSSVAQSKAYSQRNETEAMSKSVIAQKQKAIDLLLSPSQSDKQAGKDKLLDLYNKGNLSSEEFEALLKNLAIKQNRPLFDRMTTNNQGQLTTNAQARKLRDLQRFGYEP